jgi:hypothetical protein
MKWDDIIEKIEIEKDIEPTEIGSALSALGHNESMEEDEFTTFKL